MGTPTARTARRGEGARRRGAEGDRGTTDPTDPRPLHTGSKQIYCTVIVLM